MKGRTRPRPGQMVIPSTCSLSPHGMANDEPLAAEGGSGLTYYHADGLGSIVRTTNASGAVTAERRYTTWGNLETGAGEPGYAFTGREWDPETGLHSYRARYYDSNLGRRSTPTPTAGQRSRSPMTTSTTPSARTHVKRKWTPTTTCRESRSATPTRTAVVLSSVVTPRSSVRYVPKAGHDDIEPNEGREDRRGKRKKAAAARKGGGAGPSSVPSLHAALGAHFTQGSSLVGLLTA